MSSHHHHHHGESQKNIATAFFMNFCFMLFEIIVGMISGSIAIVSDSFHDLGDSLSLGVSWILESKKDKSANDDYNYGYKKLSVVGAIINIFVLIIAIFVSLYQAVKRFFNPEPIKTGIVIVVAIIGAIVNAIPIIKMKASKTISEKTVSLHLLEDVLTWCALLIVSVIVHLTRWYFLDSCFAIIICVVLSVGVIKNCISIFRIIMDAKPKQINLDEVSDAIKSTNDNIESVKELKVRDIDGESFVADIKIQLKKDFEVNNIEDIYNQINNELEKFEIHSTTIQIYF